MRLAVTTPFAIVLDAPVVLHLRAEDATGQFGILPGHADFLTVLAVSVIGWRDAAALEHYVAVRGGVLEVHEDRITVATPEAVVGDDLDRLERDVVASFRRGAGVERRSRLDERRLHLAAMRQLTRYLRPEAGGARAPRTIGAAGQDPP